MEKKNIQSLLTNYHFVVPEIQREYVWGGKKNKNVLSQFLKDLNDKITKGDANIGFLYSYRSGIEQYLIDGQQRYTTIVLLLFYLAVKEGYAIQTLLDVDSTHPAFAYRVRSCTESFFCDMVRNGVSDPKKIKDQCWYRSEYDDDTSIDSMLGALEVFNSDIDDLPSLTYDNVMEKVFFWFFDVKQTSQGEELYITMNSRGEKLSDSEQIKPRLLKTASGKKEYYGKKWDVWEEFFYSKSLRGVRSIETIDTAMNNVIRIVLELTDNHEHDHIKPIEDSAVITFSDVELYMEAIQKLATLSEGKFVEEVKRLYGDSKSDANFYVLKSLIVTYLRKPLDMREYDRVYHTVSNHVRRNKLKNLSYLEFLNAYKNSVDCSFYQVAMSYYDGAEAIEKTTEIVGNSVFTGHELEKIELCMRLGEVAEDAIWSEQSKSFWNGDIKQLILWAKEDGEFEVDKFNRVRNIFANIFNRKASEGWTSDAVRQAMITQRMPKYPLVETYYTYFGYTDAEWKKIIAHQPDKFLDFLYLFDGADEKAIEVMIENLKVGYKEIPENTWAEFVQHDYLLEYCNTKHIQHYRKEYGLECVKNSYKQPHSVKNMHFASYLDKHICEIGDGHWKYWIDYAGWHSVIKLYRENAPYSLHILYRDDKSQMYEISLQIKSEDENIISCLIDKFRNNGFTEQEYSTYKICSPINMQDLVVSLNKWIS